MIFLFTYKQGEKAAFRMGGNNSKWNNWQRINLHNIQAAQFQKKKNDPMKKWADQEMSVLHLILTPSSSLTRGKTSFMT